ncbi:MAG: hypothetical protein WA747_04035 [Steroidobacteraceae bacterium]
MSELGQWDSFYVIVGSAAGALIGLQFVVMTLIANRPQIGSPEAGAAFGSPTVIHFSTVLLLSAVLRAPWHSFMSVASFWGLVGVCGVVYTGVVVRRMRTQKSYDPVFEDWLFHALLPLLAYLALALSLFAAPARAHAALFAVGAATLLLLFVGIHNSWDAVAYHVFVNLRKAKD